MTLEAESDASKLIAAKWRATPANPARVSWGTQFLDLALGPDRVASIINRKANTFMDTGRVPHPFEAIPESVRELGGILKDPQTIDELAKGLFVGGVERLDPKMILASIGLKFWNRIR